MSETCSVLELVFQHRVALAERERDLLQEQVTTLTGHVNTLSEQLEVRALELERRDEAEAELRKLLLVSQHALQCALEQKSLPPAPEVCPEDTKPRVRWFWPWRRG